MPIDGSIPASGKLFQAPDLQRIQANQLALDEARARAKDRADQAKAAEAQRLVMDEIAKIPLMEDPETGILRPDRNAITQRFGGVMPKAVNDWLDDDDKHLSSVLSAQEAALKRGMTHVAASGFSPAAWKRQVELWGAGRVLQKDEAAEWGAIQDPEQIKQIVGTFSGQKPEYVSVNAGDGILNKQTGQVAPGLPVAPKPDEPVFATDPTKRTVTQIGTVPANAHIVAQPQPSQVAAGGASDDPKAIADAIIRGDQPPDFTGLYRMTGPIRAQLARSGYDLTKAEQDWKATQKYFQTLNGAQQIRLRQAVGFTKDSLDIVQDLANEWDGGKFPLLNKAQMMAAKNGALGAKAQAIATQLDAQISDIVSELGTVYKGGNSSTDETLKLAAKNLQSDWSKPTMTAAINLIRKNLAIRENSIKNTVAIANEGNAYAPAGAAPPEAVPPQVLAAGPGEHTFANGQVWKVSPDGKSAVRIK